MPRAWVRVTKGAEKLAGSERVQGVNLYGGTPNTGTPGTGYRSRGTCSWSFQIGKQRMYVNGRILAIKDPPAGCTGKLYEVEILRVHERGKGGVKHEPGSCLDRG